MTMRFGVNYLPRRHWWYVWAEDDDDFADDFDTIAALGFDHVRVQCLWPLFQPNPNWVSPRALRRLECLLDAAAERELAVCVTVLDGWLSGFDFRPTWVKDADPFTDAAAISAAARLVSAVASAVADHPALWCLDIANEPNVLMHDLAPGSAQPWADAMLTAARTAGVPLTIGVDHVPWMTTDGPLHAEYLAASCDLVAVHAWPLFSGALRLAGEERAWAVPDFLAQLARSIPTAQGKPLWIQELGVSPLWLTATTVPDFAERMLRRAAAVPDVAAVTWWASHDIPPHLGGFDELEYGLGLIDADGVVKDVGHRLSSVIGQLRLEPASKPCATPPLRLSADASPDSVTATWFDLLDPVGGPAIQRIVRE